MESDGCVLRKEGQRGHKGVAHKGEEDQTIRNGPRVDALPRSGRILTGSQFFSGGSGIIILF